MAKKQFKIGEYALGGIIDVQTNDKIKTIEIQARDFRTKAIVRSNTFAQANIEMMDDYLNELTSYYYAEKVLNWIKSVI
jgi:hypothetical protein